MSQTLIDIILFKCTGILAAISIFNNGYFLYYIYMIFKLSSLTEASCRLNLSDPHLFSYNRMTLKV